MYLFQIIVRKKSGVSVLQVGLQDRKN